MFPTPHSQQRPSLVWASRGGPPPSRSNRAGPVIFLGPLSPHGPGAGEPWGGSKGSWELRCFSYCFFSLKSMSSRLTVFKTPFKVGLLNLEFTAQERGGQSKRKRTAPLSAASGVQAARTSRTSSQGAVARNRGGGCHRLLLQRRKVRLPGGLLLKGTELGTGGVGT